MCPSLQAVMREITSGDPHHASCQENLTEALKPFGLSGDDIIDIFNVFMNVDLTTDGSFTLKAPSGDKGSYIDLRAEMMGGRADA